MKKKIIIIAIVATLLVAAATYTYMKFFKPKIAIDAIDWLKGTANANFTAGGHRETIAGVVSDKLQTAYKAGSYKFDVIPEGAHGNADNITDVNNLNKVTFRIRKGENVIKKTVVDFKAKTVTELL